MANVFVPSANDPAVFTTDKFSLLKDGDGNTYRTVVKANVNGSVDVYSKGTGSFGGDELLFQYSGTRNTVNFDEGKFKNNQSAAYNSFFKSTGSNGNQILKDAKTKWYSEAPPNAAKRMATLSGYRSIAATTQARQTSNGPSSLTITTGAGTTTITSPANTEDQIGDFSSSQFGEIKAKTGTKTDDFGTWKYPDDIAPNQDVIKFTMLKYEPRSFEASQSSGFDFRNRSDTTTRSIGNVTLPIPAGIRDQNIVDWNQKDLNPFEIAAAGIAKEGITKGIDSAFGELSKTLGKLQGGENNTDAKTIAENLIAGSAIGIGQQLLTRGTGAIINPNMELLFSGPSLRPFNFTFKLSARNKEEADQIIGIIRFFKRGMAAQRAKSELFLKSPHTFKLQYLLRGKEDHPYIGQIKECALKSFSVNYTPQNNYATYESGLMVSYEITMDLQELEPVFNDEYENVPGIGY